MFVCIPRHHLLVQSPTDTVRVVSVVTGATDGIGKAYAMEVSVVMLTLPIRHNFPFVTVFGGLKPIKCCSLLSWCILTVC